MMRNLTLVLAALALATPALAQNTLKPFQKVEAMDPENPGLWKSCVVTAIHTGAYDVNCTGTRFTARDVHVRLPGGAPVAKTAAQPVSAPYKAGDLVLVSVMSLPDDWRLCVVERNQLQSQGNYRLLCGGTVYHQQPKWVREDPDAPQ
jgi:hypothetical protein